METPTDRKYTKEHEWVLMETDDSARVGISHFAQDQLGDVIHVELPAVEAKVAQLKPLGEIESVKAVSDLYSPVTGVVIEVNQAIANSPELVNADPYGQGWLVRIRMDNPRELESLLDAAQYDELTSSS